MGGPGREKEGGSLVGVSLTGPSLLPSVFPIHVKKEKRHSCTEHLLQALYLFTSMNLHYNRPGVTDPIL